MTANLSKLQNIETIQLNYSSINDSSNILANVLDVTKQSVGDLWFLGGMFIVWVFMIIYFYNDRGEVVYDGSRAIMVASGWSLLISIGFVLSPWIETVIPLMWFSSLFLITFYATYKNKARGK